MRPTGMPGRELLLQCPAAIAIAVGDLGRGVISRAHPLFYEIRRRDNSDMRHCGCKQRITESAAELDGASMR